MNTRRSCFALLLLAAPLTALAHPGHDGDHDFEWAFGNGLAHPLGGLDHVLAMLAVGLWAAQLAGRARWLVPAAFVVTMTAAAFAARFGFTVPAVEPMIAASVIVAGLLAAALLRPTTVQATLVAAGLAIAHGSAHGAEFSGSSGMTGYAAGFVLATAALHAAGFALATFASRRWGAASLHPAGWIVAAGGVALLAL